MSVNFEEFAATHRAMGFDQVLERVWPPLMVLETHVHAFEVRALLVQGDMWLTIGSHIRHLQPGDTFELDANVAHAERYGETGATYWVARREV